MLSIKYNPYICFPIWQISQLVHLVFDSELFKTTLRPKPDNSEPNR